MKTNRYLLVLSLLALLPATAVRAQITLSPVAEAVVRDGSNFSVDLDESALGYLMVKYGSGSSGKAYFKFDFTGEKPNTNGALDFTFTTARNSQRQHAQIFALNQSYPAFTGSALVWETAQANETNSNTLITDPAAPFNATPLVDFISPGSASATATISIPPPWGKFLIGNQLVLVMASPFNDPTNQANGLRVLTNSAFISFTALQGAPPTISTISNMTLVAGQTSPSAPFTVNDAEDGPANLALYAFSSNEEIVPSAGIAISGSGASRQLSVTAGLKVGTAHITMTVSDSAGNVSQTIFSVSVLPENYAPNLVFGSPVFTQLNTPVVVSFAIGDRETPEDELVIAGEIDSNSSTILASVTFGGSGTNRTATVTPVTGADGVGIVRVDVSDPEGNKTTGAFAVMVLPAGGVIFSEHFDYADGQLIPNSASFWTRRNSQAQSLRFNVSGQQAFIRPKASTDDVAAPLAGGPYAPGSHVLLYTSFKAGWVELPDVIPAVTNSVGSFVQLLNNPTATSLAVAEVATITNNLPEGSFQLGLLDANSVVQAQVERLPVPAGGDMTTATVVTRYDVDAGTSAIWVNANSEAAPAAFSIDTENPATIGYIGLRQEVGMGYIYIDDLKVLVIFKPAITSLVPAAGGSLELQFQAGVADAPSAFQVEKAAELSASFAAVPAEITATGNGLFKVTLPATGAQSFFRIKRLPLTF